MVQGLQWTVLLGVQVSIILASDGFQIYTVQGIHLTVLLGNQVFLPNTSINQSFIPVKQIHVVLNLDDDIISVQLTQCAHRGCDILHMRFLSSLSCFFIGGLGHCCWAYLVFKIAIQNKDKPILQPKKENKLSVSIRIFQRRGAWGGGGGPWEGGEITAIWIWLYIRPF